MALIGSEVAELLKPHLGHRVSHSLDLDGDLIALDCKDCGKRLIGQDAAEGIARGTAVLEDVDESENGLVITGKLRAQPNIGTVDIAIVPDPSVPTV